MSEVTNRTISLAHYRANPDNYNEHPDEQIADLRRSVRLFQQVRSVVVWDDGKGGFVGVAGHGFIEAAMAEGKTEVRADVIPADWSAEQVLAYMAADNETARGSSPDLARLAALVARLKETDEELAAVAAGGDARLKELLRSLKAPAGEDDGGQVDRAAELQEKWGTATGQLWQLGEHRLICGDCTDAAVVARVMGGERAQVCVTDPPYGIAFDGSNRPDNTGRQYDELLQNDTDDDVRLNLFARSALAAIDMATCDGASIYVFFPIIKYCIWRSAIELIAKIKAVPMWIKDNPAAGRSDFFWGYEPLFYAVKAGEKHVWNGGRGQNDVWQYRNVNSFGYIKDAGDRNANNDAQIHPTQKPLDFIMHPVELSSNSNDLVYDPFFGSGTTLIACERLGRRCRAVEIEPGYVAVALERFFALTGVAPVLLEAGPAQA